VAENGNDSQYEITVQPACLLVIFDGINPRLSSWESAKADWLSSPKGFFGPRATSPPNLAENSQPEKLQYELTSKHPKYDDRWIGFTKALRII